MKEPLRYEWVIGCNHQVFVSPKVCITSNYVQVNGQISVQYLKIMASKIVHYLQILDTYITRLLIHLNYTHFLGCNFKDLTFHFYISGVYFEFF